jgi:hypothetical protein
VELDVQAQDIYTFTKARLPQVAYGDMTVAIDLADALDEGEEPGIAEATTVIDALNAAWLVRRRHWGGDGRLQPQLATACHEMCRAVAKSAIVS